MLNVAGDLPDLKALPQPCSIKNKINCDNIEIDKYNNYDKNNNIKNKMIIIIVIIIMIWIIMTIIMTTILMIEIIMIVIQIRKLANINFKTF